MTDGAAPLAGATRARPPGSVAVPFDTDPRRAGAHAAAVLAHAYPHAPDLSQLLSLTYRTEVFSLGEPPTHVLKCHADPDTYTAEVLAYDLLADQHVLPQLRGICDTTHSLLLEYVPRPVDWSRRSTIDALIDTVAAVHTAPARWHPAVAATVARWRLDAAIAAPPPAWISDPATWGMLLRMTADAHGLDHVPIGNLDLKPDHVRADRDGRLRLLDVETLRPDLTGLPDLITLPAVFHAVGLDVDPRRIRAGYLAAVTARGAAWTDRTLTTALRAFASATGLVSLHGLTAR